MLPVQITIRDIPGSATLETHIRTKSEKIKQFYTNLTSCRIVVEFEQKHKHRGKLYNIRIDVMVPGKELVTTKKSDEDVYVAIRDAFDAIIRQLDNYSHKRHGRVKKHNDIMHGHVARIIEEDGFGFIEGTDGNEYYFSVTNVKSPSFERLMIGDAVEYYPEPVNEGWQACHIIRERCTETR
jgi:ribosomal subunit interface protein